MDVVVVDDDDDHDDDDDGKLGLQNGSAVNANG